ncbi:MAG: hypothetical protein V4638_07465 [Bacteroidota bacterium]
MKKLFEIGNKWWFWMGLVVVLYGNTLGHEYVIDDQIVVTNNSLTKEGISAIPEIFKHSYLFGYDGREDESYRPLTLATFAVERSLFDANPASSHLIQVLLYGLLIFVVFQFLKLFLKDKLSLGWIFISTLLFAIHPIHTEVVANVKSRDELLCALFLFSSLLFYVKYLDRKALSENGNRFLLIALSLFFLAALSKETAIPAIVLFPVIAWISSGKKHLLSSICLLAPLGIYFLIRITVLSDVLIADKIDPVANSLALATSTSELLSSNFAIFGKYLQLMFFPWQLSWDYSVAQLPIVSFGSISSMLGLISMLMIIILAAIGTIKRNVAGFGAMLFLSTFVATSNFLFLINCPLGERFMFIPLLGLILLVIYFLQKLSLKVEQSANAMKYFSIGVVLLFAVRTIIRNQDWKNNLQIYQSGVAICPKSVKTNFNLGTEYITQSKGQTLPQLKSDFLDSAIVYLTKAELAFNAYPNIYENKSYALAELSKMENADTLKKKEYLLAAKSTIDFALDSLQLYKVNLIQNQYFNINALIQIEKDEKQRENLFEALLLLTKKAKKIAQDDYHNAFYALLNLHRKQELIEHIVKHGANFPELIGLTSEQALKYFDEKDYSSAIRLINVYMQVVPKDLGMKTNLGMMYELSGEKEMAKKIYQEVLAVEPQNVKAQTLLGNLR